LQREGVEIRKNTKVLEVTAKSKSVSVQVETPEGQTETVVGTHILVATGRKANIEKLDLEKAGVAYNQKGIKTNDGMKTTNRKVYAIGDVAGGLQFTHVAGYHAGLVVRNALFGLPVKQQHNLIPHATYTDPAIAHVGLYEAEVKKKYGDKYRVLRWSFDENDRARAERQIEGCLKVFTTNNGQILGASAVGLHADELINFYAFAIANKMKVGAFTKMVAPYPTLFEVSKRVAYEFYKDKIDNPFLKGLMAFNRLFG
jgi:pyruvate/2-oxoglutarate dehydrogenase complex dihydrolipoamide dehydrogenase (E3) component